MKIKKTFIFMITFVVALLLSINNPSISFAATPPTVALNTTTSFLVKGETTTLKVTGTSAKAAWKSNNKNIATVSSSGKVTAITYGTATIVATVNKKNYSCKVVVVDPSDLHLRPSTVTILVGGNEVNLNPESYIYSEAAIKKMGLTYEVTGNAGIKVSSTGKVTATKAGKFKVTAYIHGKKIETVSMKAEEFKGFSDPEAKVDVDGTKEIYFADNYKPYTEDVKVNSSDTKVATVDFAYTIKDLEHYYGIEITGVADGTATVSVTVSGVTKQIKVIVGVGATVLAPVDAVKSQDYTGYTETRLATLKWVRDFIDTNNLMSGTLSDREKVTIIQNYLIQTYEINVGDTVYKSSISCIVFDGVGSCGDYATTFCFFCECIDIPCYFVFGISDNGSGNGWVAHGWNKVKVDGTWYYIDTYWCAGLKSLDKYFLTTNLWSDHKMGKEGYYKDVVVDSQTVPYSYDLW